MSFYDDWLRISAETEAALASSPGVSHDADRPWESTRQDAKVKLLLSDELGFPTMGGVVLKAEIPVGWHTGVHRHGEEAIHILAGTGFVVIDGLRFDVHAGSTLQLPYRCVHQLVNTGDEPLTYVSALALSLERFVHLASVEQLEDCGPNDERLLAIPAHDSYALPSGRRVLIHLEDAPDALPADAGAPIDAYKNQHYFIRYLTLEQNGFRTRLENSVSMTHIFEEPPGYQSGLHKHLEAVLYVLDGHGYSNVNGKPERWGPGDVLHVPPAMYAHEHHNEGSETYRLLRIQFGIRYWFTQLWPEGYSPTRVYDESGAPVVARVTSR